MRRNLSLKIQVGVGIGFKAEERAMFGYRASLANHKLFPYFLFRVSSFTSFFSCNTIKDHTKFTFRKGPCLLKLNFAQADVENRTLETQSLSRARRIAFLGNRNRNWSFDPRILSSCFLFQQGIICNRFCTESGCIISSTNSKALYLIPRAGATGSHFEWLSMLVLVLHSL